MMIDFIGASKRVPGLISGAHAYSSSPSVKPVRSASIVAAWPSIVSLLRFAS